MLELYQAYADYGPDGADRGPGVGARVGRSGRRHLSYQGRKLDLTPPVETCAPWRSS